MSKVDKMRCRFCAEIDESSDSCSHYPPRRLPASARTLLLCEQAAKGIEVDLLTSELLSHSLAPKSFRLHPRMKLWGWRQFPSLLFSIRRLRRRCCHLRALG